MQYETSSAFNLIGGAEYFWDDAVYEDSNQVFSNGDNRIGFSNISAFGQAMYKSRWANVTLGGRLDVHSAFGAAFVPRLGITRSFSNWHLKAVYSNAFKAPNLFTLVANPDIEPERMSTIEFETGYQTKYGLELTANAFYSMISNPIVYISPDEGVTDSYTNGEAIATAGIELQTVLRQQWGRLGVNYSYYQAVDNSVPSFEVPLNSTQLLGFPAHKIAGNTILFLQHNFSFSGTVVFQSSKYYLDSEENVETKPAITQLNFTVKRSHFFYPGLSAEVGVYNLLNQTQWFVPPYDIDINPVPQMGREYCIKFEYRISH